MRISIDDRTEDFDTGSDGFLGTVFEFSKLDELKGIVIDLVLDTIGRGSLDTIKEQIEKVFNCSLS